MSRTFVTVCVIYNKVCPSPSNQQFFSMVTHSFLNMFLIGLYQYYLSVGCEHTLSIWSSSFMRSFLFALALHILGTITFFHLNPSYWFASLYILRTAYGRTDGDDVY